MCPSETVAVLYSGGKDSTYAIEMLRRSGYRISCLVSIISENADSYMLHTASIRATELTASALDIPLVFGYTKGEKERELDDIRDSILKSRKDFYFDFIGSGALCSEYQRSRLAKIAKEIGIGSLAPLWGRDQKSYLREIVRVGYEFILTSVSAAGLNESWLGKKIDEKAVEEILKLSEKYRFNPALEGGEGETLVLDCPLYRSKRLVITHYERKWDGTRGILEIKKAVLVEKNGVSSESILQT